MRGIVSAAMLIALSDLGLAGAFDVVYGSSAGAINAAYFLQGGRWDALALYYSELSGTNFINPRRVLFGHPVVDLRFVRDAVLLGSRPIDYETITESGVRLFVAVTNVDTCRCDIIGDFESSQDLAHALGAGSWLPILGGRPPIYRNHRYLDGGLLLSHPASAALAGGCTHVVVLNTRYPRQRTRPELWRILLRRYLNSLQKGLGDEYWDESVRTLNHRIQLHNLASCEDSHVVTISPGQSWSEISRLERGVAQLLRAAREGYEAAIEGLTGERPRTAYAITRVPAGLAPPTHALQ